MSATATPYARVGSDARKSAGLTFCGTNTNLEAILRYLAGYDHHFTLAALALLKPALGEVSYVRSGQVRSRRAIGFPLPGGGWHVCDLSKPHSDRWRFTDGGKIDLLVVNRDPAEPLVLYEGEWDLLAALSLGIPNGATGTGGAGNFKPEWAAHFQDRDAVVCSDVDPPGLEGREKAAAVVETTARRVRVVTLPLDGTPQRKDFRDWVRQGGTLEAWGHLVETAPEWSPPALAVVEDPSTDDHVALIRSPHFPRAAWRGLFGTWRDLLVPCTEAPSVMHFLTFTVVAGLLLRRRVWFNHPHPTFPNFYAGFIAPTGDPRKTTALAFGERLAREVGERLTIIYGLASPEGLLERLAAYREEEDAHGKVHRVPIPSPAALAYCDELGAILAKTRQEGSAGLLPTLARLYDGRIEDENPTRGRPIRVIEPTLGLLTGATPEVLERGLRDEALTDGFLNRMIWATTAELPAPISDPQPPEQTGWNGLLKRVRDVLNYWGATGREIPLSLDAKALWADLYRGWFRERQEAAPGLIHKATARSHLHIRKLAVLAAALDCRPTVDRDTLEWAADLGAYFEEVTRWLLQDAVVAPTRNVAVEQRVVRYLRDRAKKPAERSTRAVTKALWRHADSGEVCRTLENLRRAGRVGWEEQRTPSGQRTDCWTLTG